MATHRKARVGDQLLSFLAEQIRRLGDPRLESVTLTGVEMTPDLKTAHIHWTSHSVTSQSVTSQSVGIPASAAAESAEGAPTQEAMRRELAARNSRIAQIGEALVNVTGLLKRRIGSELHLRFTPELRFHHDQSLDTAARIETLLHAARQHSAQREDDVT